MVQGKFISGQSDLKDILYIRSEVFAKELKITQECKQDSLDIDAIHAVVYEGASQLCPISTGRLIIHKNVLTIDKIAVLPDYRGKGYGDFVVRMLLDKAKSFPIEDIVVNVPKKTTEFFNKVGFHIDENILVDDGNTLVQMNYIERKGCPACQNKRGV
ncbi:MAG TPA: GNAT family N-acetyltransferase [Mobilitalea sp.]|nr:GNAT family N-acetyltransferase [Mobilitalea sp.]